MMKFCMFGNFRENFIFANSVCDVKNLRLWYDLPASVKYQEWILFSPNYASAKFR